jgi:methylglutaconyl-CoA hydratase
MEHSISNQGHVKSHRQDAVMTIEFGHPAHNSLPAYLLDELVQAIDRASDDDAVKVVVLRSFGERSFCAGASFQELIAIENEAQGLAFFSGFARVINAMRRCKKLIIARVQGKAVGGGVGIIAAADYALAMETAAVKLSELTIGIGPFVIAPAVSRKIGVAGLSALSIDAQGFRSARWAESKGLYTQVFDSVKAMDNSLADLCKDLSAYNIEAMRNLKAVLWAGTEHWDDLLLERAAMSGRLVLSPETKSQLAPYKQSNQ